MKCRECGAKMTLRGGHHHYTESGLPDVWLGGVDVRSCSSCDEEVVTIPNIEGLHDLLAQLLRTKKAALTGEEIRFLRAHIGWSGQDFARMMRSAPATVSRWENNKQAMGSTTEALFRLYLALQPKVDDYLVHDAAVREPPNPEELLRQAQELLTLLPDIAPEREAASLRPLHEHDRWSDGVGAPLR